MNEVKIALLTTGTVVLGKDTPEYLTDVLGLIPAGGPGQLRIGPMLPPFTQGPVDKISKSHVVFSSPAPDELVKGYQQLISGIITAGPGDLQKIEQSLKIIPGGKT